MVRPVTIYSAGTWCVVIIIIIIIIIISKIFVTVGLRRCCTRCGRHWARSSARPAGLDSCEKVIGSPATLQTVSPLVFAGPFGYLR